MAHQELERRQRLWRMARTAPPAPWLLAVDEWTSLLRGRDADRLLDLLEDIAQQGRKYGVAVMLVAQSWSAAAVGSSQLRNPLPAAIVHRCRPDEARMLSGLPAASLPSDVHELAPGEAYVVGLGDAVQRVRVPRLEAGSGWVRDGFATGSERVPGGFAEALTLPSEPTPNPVGTHSEPAAEPSAGLPEGLSEERVAALLRAGLDIGQVVETLTGLKRGESYRRAHLAVQRWLVRRGLEAR